MFKAIIFDLDGTLLNTLDDLADSGNEMLSNHNFPVHPVKSYRYFVGDGVEILIKRMLPGNDNLPDEDQLKKLTLEFKEIYHSRMFNKTKPYDGIIDLLKKLNDRFIPICVLSNKPHEETLSLVYKLLKDIKFEVIKGANKSIPRKPDPMQALLISKQLNKFPEEFLYIGDTDIDMKTAKNAGMYGVGVLWGFREKNELVENGAKILVEQPIDILKII